jgi:hypothetical protein
MNMNSNQRDIPFGSFQHLNRNVGDRKVVLFGAGDGAHKTGRKLGREYAFIVDNNPNMWHTIERNKDVLDPEEIKGRSDEFFVLICTTSFVEVSKQLESFGFSPQNDYIVSPILNDLRIISELENHCAKLLFTSGLPEIDDKECGGGVYELKLKGHLWEYRKVYSGICYGIIEFEDTFITIDDKLGIVQMDQDYNVLKSKELKHATRGHGLSYSEKYKRFYVVSSYRDSIIVLDQEFNSVDEIFVSGKFEQCGEPEHHCNDLCVVDDSLYISMFSHTGNWKRDIFDGVALEVSLVDHSILKPVISNLWMPHNISFLDGSLTVLDSLRGELKTNNARPIGRFPAFTRGLDYDGIFYYIGQSRNRNYSKNLGLSLNISIDTAIVIFDPVTKASRTIGLPQKLSEIHSILLLKT